MVTTFDGAIGPVTTGRFKELMEEGGEGVGGAPNVMHNALGYVKAGAGAHRAKPEGEGTAVGCGREVQPVPPDELHRRIRHMGRFWSSQISGNIAVTLIIIILRLAGVACLSRFISIRPFINVLIILQAAGSVAGRKNLSVQA